MNANHYIHNELRHLESAAHVALNQIRCSRTIREVVQGMSVQIPAVLRGIRHMAPSFPRIESEAHRRAESIVRTQIAQLAESASEAEFLKQRAALQREWQQLRGHFPKLASYTQVESNRLLVRLRAPSQSASRHGMPATR